MQHGDHYVTQHDRSSLRILGTVGEPINPHAWDWYHQVRVTNCCAACVQPFVLCIQPAGQCQMA
jgi:acyl-coenzyme A synthetase/AMP-(fatty) acid ligase